MTRWLVLAFLLVPTLVQAHTAPLDAYGCHSNKALYGNTTTRECHIDLLAGQVFKSLSAEYQAYIAAQKTQLAGVQAQLADAQTQLAAEKVKTASLTEQVAALTARVEELTKQLNACVANCLAPPTGTVTLSWSPNTEPDLAGYKIYCGTTSHVYTTITAVGKVVSYLGGNLPAGTYYCAVTAFDTAGNESAFSQEVSKVIP